MEPVPVVKKQTNVWLWVIAVIAIVLIAMWLFGAFNPRPATTPGTTTTTPGVDASPAIEAPAVLDRSFA